MFEVDSYKLDKDQMKVVTYDKNCLVLAGAGSGKSLTMVGKIKYLIEHKNIKSSDILCITFTNLASKSLEDKLKKYNIPVYTFHKLSLSILKDKKYNISPTYTLDLVIDEYFYSIIWTNKDMVLKLKRVLGLIDYNYNYIINSKELESLKKLIKTFINLFKTNNYKLNYFLKIKRNKDLISIIIDIYYLYNEELESTNSIDFNDMIVKASEYVKTNGIYNYKYIIVDEYQDTSYIRYLLLKSIVDKTNAKITCVGDDYQSIYRFNGCDINMFLNFKKYFKHSKILKINNTYRNSQELINVAGSFIMKNKNQLYKNLKSQKHNIKPIKIFYGTNLDKLINIILKDHKEILILGRNNFDIKGYEYLLNDNIKFMTVHASKGLESECVLIINNKNDILGFPNKIKDDKVLKYLTKYKNIYPYDEERRLFYVALTRSKTDVYLLVDRKNKSIFINELVKDYCKYIEYI